MMYDLARVERHHLSNQKGPDYSLVRKRCGCGAHSTARQLAQHGKCAACVLDAIRSSLPAVDLYMLSCMVGAGEEAPTNRWGHRNHYCVARGGQQHEAMRRLVNAGLVNAGRECGWMLYFHATRQGCKVAGLGSPAVRRAMSRVGSHDNEGCLL